MKNRLYKIYELEDVLTTYINENGILNILNYQDSELSNGSSEK